MSTDPRLTFCDDHEWVGALGEECPECKANDDSFFGDDDESPDLNREGDPAFNGAFNRW